MGAIPPAPPLAFNAKMQAAARAHAQDMLAHAVPGSSGNGRKHARFAARGRGLRLGELTAENIFSYSKSVFYGHAGFEIDWGGPASNGGMQTPPIHRQIIHSRLSRNRRRRGRRNQRQRRSAGRDPGFRAHAGRDLSLSHRGGLSRTQTATTSTIRAKGSADVTVTVPGANYLRGDRGSPAATPCLCRPAAPIASAFPAAGCRLCRRRSRCERAKREGRLSLDRRRCPRSSRTSRPG